MSKKKNEMIDNYTANDIDIMEGLEAVRKRPEMYIGSVSEQGLHHLIWELVDNSIDESIGGFCNHILVRINEDNSLTVEDNGRGMPVDIHVKTGRPAVEILFTVLHAGGKFGGNGYQVSGGLHGVGIKTVNALSTKTLVNVKRDNRLYEIEFSRGKVKKELSQKRGKVEGTGTTVTFHPDPMIFDTTEFDRTTIHSRLYELAYLNPKLKITFQDCRDGEQYEKVFYSENGIPELLEAKTSKMKQVSKDLFVLNTKKEIDRINPDTKKEERIVGESNIVFKYTSFESDVSYTFVNNIRVRDGEHLKAFKQAVTKAFNKIARESKLLKEKEKDIRDKDVLAGLVSIISIRFPFPRFEGQTKETLSSKEGYDIVYDVVHDEALKYFKKEKILVKNIVTISQKQDKMREELKATKEMTQDNSLLTNDSLPGKLADCSSDDIRINEIYIVEGDSAGGSAKQGRDREYQAILSLFGKVLNVQGQPVKKVLDNMVIKSIIASLGCGVREMYDPSKLRYGKVIFLTDADVDGAHINSLLLTFFYHYLRPMIEEGRLFLALPPLYKIKFKSLAKQNAYMKKNLKTEKGKLKDVLYVYSDQELAEATNGIDKSNFEVQRYKGLGEMNAEQLWETTMDPSVRYLHQVRIQDFIHTEDQLETFMGTNNQDKVEFIRKIIKAYKLKKANIKNVNDMEELAELNLSDDEVSKDIEKQLSQYDNIIEKHIMLKTLTGVLKSSIGDYAYYVNIKRSIPDIRDGLKPVQRRIIWAMHKEKMTKDKPYKKAARVVGEVIGKYHPHGDSSVYDALVKLSQDFHENIPILDFHGNVGSIDGDGAAAMRYTEVRMDEAAQDMMEYIDYDTVEFEDNFSFEYKEPLYLPGKFPYVLVNGTQGLGVSISTNIPSHNILEVLNGIELVLDKPNATIKEIMKHIKGPDFPTGGILVDSGIKDFYETGNGTYKVRAKMHTEIIKGKKEGSDKQALVITEIPYNVSKEFIIKKVREAVMDKKVGNTIVPKKITDIVDYKDESDKRSGVRLIFFLKKTANAEKVKKQLYKYTPLESSYKVNLLAIEDEEIKIFSLKGMIESYIRHRQIVLRKRFEYELNKIEARKHLLDGYIKILKPSSNLDKAIEIIRSSKDNAISKSLLMKTFDLTDIQAQYILDRRLATLSKSDIKTLEQEIKELASRIKELKALLKDVQLINDVIRQELNEMKAKYPIKRKTEIIKADKVEAIDLATEDVAEAEEVYVALDNTFSLKKVSKDATAKEKSSVKKGNHLIEVGLTDSSQKLLGLTSQNVIIQSNIDVLPKSTDKVKSGVPYDLKKELGFTGKLVSAKLNIHKKSHVILLFEDGEVEKMPISYFQSAEYLYPIKLVDILFVNEDDNFFIATKEGLLIVTTVNQFREGKKQSAIKLGLKDKILTLGAYNENEFLFVATEGNYVNLVPMNEFSPQTKGGKGIMYFKKGAKTGLPKLVDTVCSPTANVLVNDESVSLDTLTPVATRTVIGKQLDYEVKTISRIIQ